MFSIFCQGAFAGSYGVRSAILTESSSSGNALTKCQNGGIGLLRSYLTSIGAGKQVLKSHAVEDFNLVSAIPRLRRLFSSQAPKKSSNKDYYAF